jgi:sulfite reductase alpha subunit-like flavoprotein
MPEYLKIRISKVFKPERGSFHDPSVRTLATYKIEDLGKTRDVIEFLNGLSEAQVDLEALLEMWPQLRRRSE